MLGFTVILLIICQQQQNVIYQEKHLLTRKYEPKPEYRSLGWVLDDPGFGERQKQYHSTYSYFITSPLRLLEHVSAI